MILNFPDAVSTSLCHQLQTAERLLVLMGDQVNRLLDKGFVDEHAERYFLERIRGTVMRVRIAREMLGGRPLPASPAEHDRLCSRLVDHSSLSKWISETLHEVCTALNSAFTLAEDDEQSRAIEDALNSLGRIPVI